ncbi:hypothetical protein ACS5PU_21370 [Pedobacter sp. GSP4]|uniref:hypothetical protein n=1 Tax=Pedobacter sp. GSP4 TaxID=3453716 RepID=UPI003EE87E04
MISVFKTNVSSDRELNKISPLLNRYFKEIKWNIDLWDNDKILRVDSNKDWTAEITALFSSIGLRCTHLEVFHTDPF